MRSVMVIAALSILLAVSIADRGMGADVKGATLGTWTMDLGAAKKLAAQKKLPILLNFTGSDWCGWCKLMEKNVFTKPEWKAYAKKNLLMVALDFPKDKSIVPEKYVKRNDELKNMYGVEGFPTFIVLDDDGDTVLGRTGAGQEKTPESFEGEVAQFCRYRDAEVARYAKGLKPADRTAYRKIIDEIAVCRKAMEDQKQQVAAAQKKVEELENKAA
ncbi:thioredoxin family protein, partial [Planctomycetota bacterium]